MTEHSAVTGMRGRGGIVSLVESTLALDRAAERPLTMLLGPRGSGTSELLCVLMEQFGTQYPFGYVKFTSGQELLPRYALGLLARQLARNLPSYRHTSFPRLALGLLASDQNLPHQALTGGQRGIRGALTDLEKKAKHQHGDYLGAYLTVAQASIDAPEGASRSARTLLSAATDTSARSWAGRWDHSAAAWFGQHRLTHSSDPWESLLELNRWRHQGEERDKLRLDQLLCAAFLEDLRTSVKGPFRPRSYLLLLDETHTDHGREFLDLLLQARHDDTVLGRRPCDPLSVVAGCNRWLPRWGPATGEEWPWQPREPDRASLADWREHRPSGDGQDTWWYPLRMRDLDREEVRIHVEQQLNTHPELGPFTTLAPFVHRLTGGLPKAVQQVFEVLGGPNVPQVPGPQQNLWLRDLPQRTVSAGGRKPLLVDAALDDLLADFDAADRDRLAQCAAADDLFVGAQLLGRGAELFTDIRSRWLLSAPGTLSLHPWLRRMLLWHLAGRAGAWDTAHEVLAEHYANGEQRVQELYHLLALEKVDEVAEYLVTLRNTARTEEWLSAFHAITSAPNRLAHPGGPLELRARLAPSDPGDQVTVPAVIRDLVVARWLWSDPLTDPGRQLSPVLADGFVHLSRLWRNYNVALVNEAERYRLTTPTRTSPILGSGT
ncbi:MULTISPECIES: hypothetical protein [unclassified Streptomyces]|uniref:hypothetical protein n=1 Tax=unclassified Streptomyces TaxID=2593676 RepID=UPI002DD8702B|nr:hypothetical protein [Streptomyces sp. NBC_01445]WSE03322.1 hypothetical protein OG574_07900 [Streptomyces sp. NBC_01445]